MLQLHNRHGIAWCAMLAVLICGLWVVVALRREPPLAPVTLLKRPFSPPLLLRDRLGQFIPRSSSWNWARRLEDSLFGQRRPINFNQEIFTIAQPPDKSASQLQLGPPVFSGAAAPAVWFLSNSELKALRERLQQIGPKSLCQPRVGTAEGVGASLFVGGSVVVNGSTNQVGLEVDYFARVRKEWTDLFTSVQVSQFETNELGTAAGQSPLPFIRTNLDFAARMQIPKGCGVFLLSNSGSESNKTCMGVIVDPP